MTADERIESLAQEQLAEVHGGELALVGEDSPFFRAVRRTAPTVGVTIHEGFRATTPVLIDTKSEKYYVLHPINDVDKLVTSGGMSCVSQATLLFLDTYGLSGKHVCVVGRGHAVKGLPEALLAHDATVTVCHSKTRYLPCLMQEADMVVIAAPIHESFRPRNVSVIVDISGALAKDEDRLKSTCEYTRHIGRLTVAVLLRRVAQRREWMEWRERNGRL